MLNTINLTCPSCGGKLQVTGDIDRFSCGYCGNELIIQRSGGIVTVAPVVAELREVRAGVDKTSAELAITRLTGEINNLAAQRDRANNAKDLRYTFAGALALIGLLFGWAWLIMITGSSASEDFGAKTFCLMLAVILGLIGYWIYSSTKTEIKTVVTPINKIITEKLKELKLHQEIVKRE